MISGIKGKRGQVMSRSIRMKMLREGPWGGHMDHILHPLPIMRPKVIDKPAVPAPGLNQGGRGTRISNFKGCNNENGGRVVSKRN